jgi:rubrerythrin
MAWVRITIRHGPGHQSETVKYTFLRRATEEAIEEAVEEEGRRRDYEYPITEVRKIAALPASEHKSLVQHYHYRRDDAVAMLEILGKTKTIREYEWRCRKCGNRWTRFAKKCPNAVCGGRVRRVVKGLEDDDRQ